MSECTTKLEYDQHLKITRLNRRIHTLQVQLETSRKVMLGMISGLYNDTKE